MQRFVQQINLTYDWFAGNPTATTKELGHQRRRSERHLRVSHVLKFADAVLVTPGFAVHYWEGRCRCTRRPPLPAGRLAAADLRRLSRLRPGTRKFPTWFGAELNFRIGVYSDFSRVTSDSIRFMGKGMAVLKLSPHMKLKAGVWYLDRIQVKILPAGGFVWTPNADVYFNILFPNPKIGKRLTTWGTTDWWLYAAGDYGGGTLEDQTQQRADSSARPPMAPSPRSTTTTFALPWAWSSTPCGSSRNVRGRYRLRSADRLRKTRYRARSSRHHGVYSGGTYAV